MIGHRELTQAAWAGAQVEESNLRFQIGQLRKALAEHADGADTIASVPGRGYCLTAAVARGAGAAAGPPAPHGRLPPVLPEIVGRKAEIDGLSARLATRRLVTVVGPGGVGKTTVATAVAHAIEAEGEGVAFVDLAALSNLGLVPSAVAAELKVTVQSPDPVPALALLLAESRTLIVLDNCEHVVEAAAIFAERLLSATGRARILATSREPLRAADEMVCRLAPLPSPPERANLPDAVQEASAFPAFRLFVARARHQLGDFGVGPAEAELIAEICRRLDGIPLAIELAVGRLGALGLAGLAEVLRAETAFVGRGRRTASLRQQTLQAALGWSYDLLSPDEAAALRALSVFSGSFPLDAALSVIGGTAHRHDLVAILASLVEKSLVIAEPGGRRARYRLLETMRLFSADRLREAGEEATAGARHAAWYRDHLVAAAMERHVRPESDGITQAAPELSNVRAALARCFSPAGDEAVGVALAAAAAPLFIHLSLLAECDAWAERVAASPARERLSPSLRLELEAARSVSLRHTRAGSDLPARTLAGALALADELGDVAYQIRLREAHFVALFRTGRLREAREHVEAGTRRIWHSYESLTTADWMLGIVDHAEGRFPDALRRAESALRHYPRRRRSEIVRFGLDQRIFALAVKARASWLLGLAGPALAAVAEAVAEAEEMEHPVSLATALYWTSPVLLWAGHLEAAEASRDRLLSVVRRHAIHNIATLAQGFVGALATLRGDSAGGAALLAQALAGQAAVNYLATRSGVQVDLAAALIADGRPDEAHEPVDAVIARGQESSDAAYLAEAWRLKARVLERTGPDAAAARETALRTAIATAQAQRALAWELRAAVDLARFLREDGRDAEAATVLAGCIGAFAAESDTPDLRAARDLLGSLPPAHD